MSHRFPQIASQYDFTRSHRRDNNTPVFVLALAQIPSLPWFELAIGTAFLMATRYI